LPRLSSKKVLVVDDEPDIAESAKMGPEASGLKIDTFSDPQEALDNFKPNEYEIAILDMRMPNLNGFQLYREIKTRDNEIRVIFFTAFEEYREEFRKAFPEFDERRFLKKPVTIAKLKEQLLQELGTSQT
jgi:two-component system catabolic regulation response regulator CreB/two-component system response regulator ChvI